MKLNQQELNTKPGKTKAQNTPRTKALRLRRKRKMNWLDKDMDRYLQLSYT